MKNAHEINEALYNLDQVEDLKNRFLTFSLDKEVFALRILYVTEIISMQDITAFPQNEPYIRGVINLRGKVVAVMDIRRRFGMADVPYNNQTCIIVLHMESLFMGVIVDRISEVIDIPQASILPCHDQKKISGGSFISGFGKIEEKFFHIIDVDKLLEGQLLLRG